MNPNLELKRQARLQKQLDRQSPPEEVGLYAGIDTSKPQGQRHKVNLPRSGQVYGEFLSTTAQQQGARVAVYYSSTGCLFVSL